MANMSTQPVAYGGYVPNDATFGARLVLVRQAMGWGNVRKAAETCGLPVESWRGWERDNRDPRGIHLIAEKIVEATARDAAGRARGGEQIPAGLLQGIDYDWLVPGSYRPGGRQTGGPGGGVDASVTHEFPRAALVTAA